MEVSRDVQPLPSTELEEGQRVYEYDAQTNQWVAQDGHTITEEDFARRMIPGPGRIDP